MPVHVRVANPFFALFPALPHGCIALQAVHRLPLDVPEPTRADLFAIHSGNIQWNSIALEFDNFDRLVDDNIQRPPELQGRFSALTTIKQLCAALGLLHTLDRSKSVPFRTFEGLDQRSNLVLAISALARLQLCEPFQFSFDALTVLRKVKSALSNWSGVQLAAYEHGLDSSRNSCVVSYRISSAKGARGSVSRLLLRDSVA